MLIPFLLAVVTAAPADPAPSQDADRATLRQSLAATLSAPGGGGAVALPDRVGDPLRRWAERNRPALHGIRPSGLPEQPWGLTASSTGRDGSRNILLYVFDWHVSGRLVVYGLTGGAARASMLTDPDAKPLPIEKLGKSLAITVPKSPPDPLVTVIVLRLRGDPEVTEVVARPAEDGRVVMHARDAVIVGRTVRYEPEPHKDTIGYWTDPADRVQWRFRLERGGKYRVEILQGCGKGSGGSEVEFAVGEQVLTTVVEDTGGFQNFVTRDIGAFEFARAGDFVLSVTPRKKTGVAVMDLRQVTLVPVGRGN